MTESGSRAIAAERSQWRARIGDLFELTKPRLTLLNVMATLAGFYVAATSPLDGWLLFHTLAGTFLVGGGCGALNMYAERQHDHRMKRTAMRPLPSGRVTPLESLVVGVVMSVAGVLYLALAVNLLTGVLGLATLISYLFFYTPLKRLSTLNTIVGAIPGGIPPMMGWTAVTNSLDPGAWVLFAILFFWQMPHFLALAWMYRKDYEQAGYKMLTVLDPDGISTTRQILMYSAALLPVSLIPTMFGIAGKIYFWGALFLGLAFIILSLRLLFDRQNINARWVFHYSLIYLPLLLLTMALDRGSV
ncbi:MAG: protoheme IX farnesyltransferase [Chlorobi bacterium]|nr:MAG: protoheme IX farnesyltransferase [Chlorobi bacterium OLB7]MBK8912640.1 protoheme IX farnesyltransferase [Chlorobiota bacterium]